MNTAIYALDVGGHVAKPLRERWMEQLGFNEPQHLENWLASTGSRLFGREILWIARQDRGAEDQRSDLIGIDAAGNLIIAELKRGIVQASALTQALTYAAEYVDHVADDLARLFYDHSRKGGVSSLVLMAESEEAAAQRLSDHVATDGELNESQILLLVGEEFSPSVLSVCDYMNQASGDATFSVECWRAKIYEEEGGGLYLAVEQIVPQPSVRAAIEERREQAKARKRARDPARREFVSELLAFLRKEGIEAHRAQGQSYGFQVAGQDLSLNFGRYAPHPQVHLPSGHGYDKNTFPPELQVQVMSGEDGGGDILSLGSIRGGSPEFSEDIGGKVLTLLRQLLVQEVARGEDTPDARHGRVVLLPSPEGPEDERPPAPEERAPSEDAP